MSNLLSLHGPLENKIVMSYIFSWHLILFTFSTIRSIKYCIGSKNRPRDFDESPRFEGH